MVRRVTVADAIAKREANLPGRKAAADAKRKAEKKAEKSKDDAAS